MKAGYLIRTAQIEGENLVLVGDINATTAIEVVGSPTNITSISFNGQGLSAIQQTQDGTIVATLNFSLPSLELPSLASLNWKMLDSVPEIQPTYDDSRWTPATLNYTNNTFVQPFLTPVSLYASDYGYNTGYLLFRGHFTANGEESTLSIQTQGGYAYGASVWLNNSFLDSWPGNSVTTNYTQNIELPTLQAGQPYVITLLMDNNGNDENDVIEADQVGSICHVSSSSSSSSSSLLIPILIHQNFSDSRF